MNDPYKTLEIERTATAEDIKKSYRRLAKELHPDRNIGDKDAEARFKKVQEAYDILSDPSKKSQYDNPHFNFPHYDDLFQSIFGNSGSQGEHGDHIVIQVKTDLENVLKGSKLDIEFSRKQLCESCSGAGGIMEKCQQCNGSGWFIITGRNAQVKRSCNICNATGRFVSKPCEKCLGSGFSVPKTEKLTSTIPPGVETGSQFAFKGRGHPGRNGGRPGNVFVNITVEPHRFFKRGHSGDLFCEIPVTYSQLVLGDNLEVSTLDHNKVSFFIPPGTQSGSKFRLQKQGLPRCIMPEVTPESRGDLFAEVKLQTPTNLSEEHIAAVEKLVKFEKNVQ